MVGSMQEDNSGNLWLGTNQGLAKLTISGKEKGRVRIFTVADGLADNFFNQNASFYRDGTFYFGCSRGIVTSTRKWWKRNMLIFSLCITDILVDGRPLEQMSDKKRKEITPFTSDFTDRLVIPASYSHFTICFASLTYNRPQQNKYAYRLQGLMLIGIMWTLPAGLPIIPNCLQGSTCFSYGQRMRMVIGVT